MGRGQVEEASMGHILERLVANGYESRFCSQLWEANGGFSAGVVYDLISMETPALEWGVPAFKTKSRIAISECGIHPSAYLGPMRSLV